MRFSTGLQLSREFIVGTHQLSGELENWLNPFFKDRSYSETIICIYAAGLCVSKQFEPFVQVRPLKVIEKRTAIEFEFNIGFDWFFEAPAEQKIIILKTEFVAAAKQELSAKPIKGFDSTRFIEDLDLLVAETKGL